MNIKEMHTSIATEMNKINSALFENILEQEVDFALNNSILRFIKQRYNATSNLKGKGFEMSQKRIDDLRTLVTNYSAKAFLPVSFDPDINEKVVFYFPADYMFAVNSRFKVAENDCGTFNYTSTSLTTNISTFDFGLVTDWTLFRLRNLTSGYVLNLGSGASNYNTTEDLTYVIRIILQKLRENYNYSEYEFYYEYYNGSYFKNQLIIVNKTTTTWQYSINNAVSYVNLATSSNVKTHYTNAPTISVAGKLVQEDDIFAMQVDPFNKTVSDFPLFYTSNYNFNIYIDRNNFVVTDVILSYLRTPRTVSYFLNQDCDLPDHTHSEIVSMTVDYLLEAVQAGDRYKTHQEIVATNE
jgi:hypothetical protein